MGDEYKAKYKAEKKLHKETKKDAVKLQDKLDEARAELVNVRQQLSKKSDHVALTDLRTELATVRKMLKKTERQLAQKNEELEKVLLSSKVAEQLLLNKESEIRQLKEEKNTIATTRKRLPPVVERQHPNHNGKRAPADSVVEQENRFKVLVGEKERFPIHNGNFVKGIHGAQCYGYPSECGTNVILKDVRKANYPKHVLDAVRPRAEQLMNNWKDRNTGLTMKDKEAEKVFYKEFVLCSAYSLIADLQGPVYIDGRRPYLKNGWHKNTDVGFEDVISEQPNYVADFFEMGFKEADLGGISDAEKKKLVMVTLTVMTSNWMKHAFGTKTTGNSGRGVQQRKVHVPEYVFKSKSAKEYNESLPELPPTADGTPLPPPLVGQANPNPKQKKRRVQVSKELPTKEVPSKEVHISKKQKQKKEHNGSVGFPVSAQLKAAEDILGIKPAGGEESDNDADEDIGDISEGELNMVLGEYE